jgi:hypothetical protein
MTALRILAVASFAASLATAAPAQEPSRCALLGQVATSSFLQFARALSTGVQTRVDASIDRLAQLTVAYNNLGCDRWVLGRAMDCVLDAPAEENTRDVALACLAAEGLATAQAAPAE